MKHIDADRLKKAIEDKGLDCSFTLKMERLDTLALIDGLQQEQPEVDLENYLENYFKGWHVEEEIGLTKPDGWSCIVDDLKDIARHFYELGCSTQYQKDRGEFAKLKAKEWQDGFDEGYKEGIQ